jgi:hypothetical protein
MGCALDLKVICRWRFTSNSDLQFHIIFLTLAIPTIIWGSDSHFWPFIEPTLLKKSSTKVV